MFIDCFDGYPDSVGDIRIFRNSDLWSEVRRDIQAFFPNQEYIIGDRAYPVLSWCMSAYRDRGNSTQAHNLLCISGSSNDCNVFLLYVQRQFNTTLAKVRQVIERAFALLKGRFRRLKYLDMNRTDKIPYVILACTVLHNICLQGLAEDDEDFIQEGIENQDIEQPEPANPLGPDEDAGVAKRDFLAALIQQR